MKKIILSVAFLLSLTTISIAQGGNEKSNHEESKRKLEASKIAYMTSYLDLSSEEAAKFWPIYNEYQQAKKDLYGTKGKRKKTSELTDAEATAKLNSYITMESEKAKLKTTYLEKFRTILSDKKVLMLTKAEGDFKRQVVKRYADRRRGGHHDGSKDKQKR